MARIFVSQERIDAWSLAKRAEIRDDRLTLAGAPSCPLRLIPAVHLAERLSGEDDRGMLGTVRSEAELAEAGADRYLDALQLRGRTYSVRAGYLCEALRTGRAPLAELAAALARLA